VLIKLYGFAVSNYYNMVKLALEEKGIAYQEVATMPSQESDYKAKSPMGKVPCIETESGFLSETGAILDYLEELKPTPHLYPNDRFARAKTREMMRIIELYVELPARRHFGHLFFGAPRNEAAFEEVKPVIEGGVNALKQIAQCTPYLCGAELTMADIYACQTFPYANMVTQKLYDLDIVAAIPSLKGALDAVAARPTAKKVDADQQAGLAAFMAQQK
jgi:glutathione S-transferase